MNIELAVVADWAAVTQEGKLVIGGIFDRVMAPHLPWQQPAMSLVFRLGMEPGEARGHMVRVLCVDDDGADVLPPIEQSFEVPTDDMTASGSANFIFAAGGVTLPKAGRYAFEVFVDGEHMRSVPFEVVFAAPPGEDASDTLN